MSKPKLKLEVRLRLALTKQLTQELNSILVTQYVTGNITGAGDEVLAFVVARAAEGQSMKQIKQALPSEWRDQIEVTKEKP